jgi:hypothetical protein
VVKDAPERTHRTLAKAVSFSVASATSVISNLGQTRRSLQPNQAVPEVFSVSLCLLRNKIYDCWKQGTWRNPTPKREIGWRIPVSSPTRLAPQSKCSVVKDAPNEPTRKPFLSPWPPPPP